MAKPQLTFSDMEYSNRKRITKKEEFLNLMDDIVAWEDWTKIIEPYYPKGERGRPPIGIEKMLRMFLLQSWFDLSDEGIEDAIYDSYAMRAFMGIDFVTEGVPDSTTLCKFRELLNKHGICKKIFDDVTSKLDKAGLIMHGGTIVDATIISAPSSKKNSTGSRDPEMHQTKKGNQWYHGMKVHIGVDAGTGYVHTIEGTAANVHDSTQAYKLIRNDDTVMYGDSGYLGVSEQDVIKNDEHLSKVDFRINIRPSSMKISDSYDGINWDKKIEHQKSSVRCKVEHPFLIVKRLFGYAKVVYKGIAKNMNRFFVLFASADLLMCARAKRTLVPITG